MSGSLITRFIGRQTRNCTPGGMTNPRRKADGGMRAVKTAANAALVKRGVDPTEFHSWNELLRKGRK